MTTPKNRIGSIGLELEGGWQFAPTGLKRDGSVVGLSSDYQGEIASVPLKSRDEAVKWLRANYPQEVNNTCGFHVHVGIAALHYSRLMCEEFNSKFLAAMEDFWNCHRGATGFDLFRSRLDGQNAYCQKIFRPEQQLWRNEAYGDRHSVPRYSQLNFCYGRHGTLECRLFPCFASVNHSIAGMEAFLDCINEFLSTCQPSRPIHISIPFETPSEVVIRGATHVATI